MSNKQYSTSWNVLPSERIQNVIRSDEKVEPEMTDCESEVGLSSRSARSSEKWTIRKHAALFPTDAYSTIEFQGLIIESRRKRNRPHLKDSSYMLNGGNIASSHEIIETVNVSALARTNNVGAVFNLPGSDDRSSSISSVQSRISEHQQAGIASRKTPPKQIS
ncbi:unnamed protein product, partial [Onchocerca ochengi]|uniref:Uncharacterized protein n=1 Tax=Onchocerca ochengi TaxID=42157 RepID=A0A182ETD9_ONCOC